MEIVRDLLKWYISSVKKMWDVRFWPFSIISIFFFTACFSLPFLIVLAGGGWAVILFGSR